MRSTLLYILIGFAASILSISAQADSPRLIFDQGHGQLFYIDRQESLDLSKLAESFTEAGFDVSSTRQPITPESLKNVDALVISGAFKSPDTSEIEAIMGFIQGGGKLAIMLHVGPLVVPLLESLKVQVSMGVLHDPANALAGKSTDFTISTLGGHGLFENLKSFNLYGAWALRPNDPGVRTMAITEPSAWVSLDRSQVKGNNPQGRFPVIVHGRIGDGAFIIFGDDAIFQNQFLTGNNQQLAANLAQWFLPESK